MDGFYRLTIRPTEDKNNYYNVIVSGNVDYVKLVEDQREMVKAIHEISNLYDLKFGNVTWISEFRYVQPFSLLYHCKCLFHLGQTSVW